MRRLHLQTLFVVAVVLLAIGLPSEGRIIYVDDNGNADFDTTQAAIDDANDTDVILVAPGTYTGDGNRDIDFRGKGVTVRSKDGPRTCIIDCQGSESEPHRGFHFHCNEDANSILEGVSIVNGYADWGGGIVCKKASPTIVGCIVSRNRAIDSGGGLLISVSNVWIGNCIISHNEAGDNGGGVFYTGDDTVIIDGCTIIDNHADHSGGGIVLGGGSGEVSIHNTILWGNRATYGTELACIGCLSVIGCAQPVVRYCCIEPGPNSALVAPYGPSMEGIFGNNHNVSEDPLVVIAGDGDCHLRSEAGRWDPNSASWVQDDVTSPCIDAGDPNSPIGYEPFPNGGVINMGAYGGTSEASKSYFGEPLCETIIAGDINGDCRVDFRDLTILTQHWLAHLPAPAPVDEDQGQGQTRTR